MTRRRKTRRHSRRTRRLSLKRRRGAARKRHARRWISRKIRILRHEGYSQRQAIAVAYAMAFKRFGEKTVSLRRTLHRVADGV